MPKLNSAYADGPATWPGRSVKGDRDKAPADFSDRVADGPPTTELKFWLFQKILYFKNEALLSLMQMQPFMLYEALSFTPIKFIDPS
jgi:hypothetical protein